MWPSGHALVRYVKRHSSLRAVILPFTKLTAPKLKKNILSIHTLYLGKSLYGLSACGMKEDF